jgi:hypothetical protein
MIRIREIRPEDEVAWRGLWRDYLDFYATELPEAVYATSFARLVDPEVHDYKGFLAVEGAAPTGLAHHIFHRHGWQAADVCFLQDLYVAPKALAAAPAGGSSRRSMPPPTPPAPRASTGLPKRPTARRGGSTTGSRP